MFIYSNFYVFLLSESNLHLGSDFEVREQVLKNVTSYYHY